MSRSELTPAERLKVFIKYLSAFACAAIGGFRIARVVAEPGVTIVAYHRIIDDDYVGVRPYISVTKGALRRQIQFFKKHYSVIPLEEAVERIEEDHIDRHYLVITFDDGYRDNYDLGLDIFVSECVRPAIFITTGCVESRQELWPDTIRNALYGARFSAPIALREPEITINPKLSSRIRATKAIIAHVKNMDSEQRSLYLNALQQRLRSPPAGDRLMLSWDEVQSLSRVGVTVGSHTVSHQVLARVDERTAGVEIGDSKRILEARTGSRVAFFAYPNGTSADFTDSTIDELKKAGYSAAVTTIRGVNRNGADVFRLRRTGIYLTDTLNVIKFKLAAESFLRG